MQKRQAAVFPPRLALEPRIVFDAAIAATVAERSPEAPTDARLAADRTEPPAPPLSAREPATAPPASRGAELIFIDAAPEALAESLQGLQGEVIRLDPQRDGVQQILEAVAGRSGIDAIHLLSHGNSGEVRLGATVLNSDSLRAYAPALHDIGTHLSVSADILLYGCRVAEGDAGERFVERLGRLTRADVAASLDDTGAANLGGNWILEKATGPIEATTQQVSGFDGLLTMATITAPDIVAAVEDTLLSFTGDDLISGAPDGEFFDVHLSVSRGAISWELPIFGRVWNSTLSAGGGWGGINARLATLQYSAEEEDFNGQVTLTITATSLNNEVATRVVTLDIAAEPDAVTDVVGTERDTSVTLDPLSGPTGPDNFEHPGAFISDVSDGAHGSVTLNVDGTVTYTPAAGYLGLDSFTYTVTTGSTTEIGNVTVNVTGDNTAPTNTVPAGTLTTNRGATLSIAGVSVSDPDGNMLSSTLTVSHGTLSVGGNATGVAGDGTATLVLSGTPAEINARLAALSYTPAAGYSGADTLQLSTSDGAATDSDSATLQVLDAAPENSLPAGPLSGTEDQPLGIPGVTVAEADGDVLTTTLTVTQGTLSAGGNGAGVSGDGTASLVITGTAAQVNARLATLAYMGGLDYNTEAAGPVTLTMITSDGAGSDTDAVAIALAPEVDMVADALTTMNGTPLTADLLAGPDGPDQFEGPAAISAVSQGASGSVTLNPNGTVTYSPQAGFAGKDTFTYTVSAGGTTEQATVTVTVVANGAPSVDAPATAAMNEDGTVSLGTILVEDADDNITSIQVVVQRSAGTALLSLDTLTLVGADTGFGVETTATTVTYTFTGTQANLIATLATLTFASAPDFSGSTTVTITATDAAGQTGSDTVDVTVGPVDDTPDITIRMPRGGTTVLDVLTLNGNQLITTFNPSIYAGSQLGLLDGMDAAAGTVIVDGNMLRVTVDPAFAGTDSFTYFVDTPYGERETGTVTIDAFELPTILAPDTAGATQGSTLSFTGANAVQVSDADGDVSSVQLSVTSGTLHVTLAAGAALGGPNDQATLTIMGTQAAINQTLASLQFTPAAAYTASATLSIAANDADGQASDTVAISIGRAPISLIGPDALNATEDAVTPVPGISLSDAGNPSIDVEVNVDVGTANLDIFSGTEAQVNALLATLQYTPSADYAGPATLTIRAKPTGDNWLGPSTVQKVVNLNVLAVDDTRDDTIGVLPGVTVTFNVLTGEGGATADTFSSPNATISGFSAPGGGTLVQGATPGEFSFTASAGFKGPVTFTYDVLSGNGGPEGNTGGHVETGTVTLGLTSAPLNLAPAAVQAQEDVSFSFTGVNTISVVDTDGNAQSVQLSVTQGTLHATQQGGANLSANDASTLTITGTQADINATLASLTYKGKADFYGSDTLSILTSDAVGGTASSIVDITIDDDQDAFPDVRVTSKDTAITIKVMDNDDFEDASAALSDVTLPPGLQGTVTFDPVAKTVTYTPDGVFIGQESFTYTVKAGGVTETTIVTVHVQEVGGGNIDPVNTVPGPLTTKEDEPLPVDGISVADANDDTLTTTLTVTNGKLAAGGAGGVVTLSPDGKTLTISGAAATVNARLDELSYTPDPDWNGTDTLQVSTSDGIASDTDAITLTVSKVIDIADDTLNTTKGSTVIGKLLENDSFEGKSPVVTATDGKLGTVTVNADNTVTYRHTGATTGTDTFTYTVTSGGVTETATVTVNVRNGGGNGDRAPVNTLPASLATNEDTRLDLGMVRVSHVDGATLTSTLTVTHGTLSVGGNQSGVSGDGTRTLVLTGSAASINSRLVALRYSPDADYNGADSLRMSTNNKSGTDVDVSALTIRPVADIVADSISTGRDTAVTVNVITDGAGADNFEDARRVITSVTQGAHGSVAFDGDGRITYTPAAGYTGGDSFTYTVTSGGVTETATVAVEVKSGAVVNLPPVNTMATGELSTDEDTAMAVQGLRIADADSNALKTTVTVAHGTLTVNGAPTGVGGGGTGTLVLTGTAAEINAQLATLIYRPFADYNGADTLTLTTTDGLAQDMDSAAITIRPVADIVADTLTTTAGTAVTGNVITQGTGADNFEDSARAITAVTQGAHGTVTFRTDGTVTYTPNAGHAGADSFTYTVTSGGVTETATVSVDVKAGPVVGSAPVNTLSAAWSVEEDTRLALPGVSVSDADGGVLTTTLTVNHGKLDVGSNGGVTGNNSATLILTGTAAQINAKLAVLSYTPVADYNGADILRMSTTDGAGTDVDTATIAIQPVADITADSLTTLQQTAVTANLVSGKGGATADTFEGKPVITGVSQGANGTVSIGREGQVTYRPQAGFVGTDVFTYTVTSGGVQESAVVKVTVAPTGDGGTQPLPDLPDDEELDESGLLQYASLPPIDVMDHSPVREIRNLVYIQPVVRGEPLPTESRTPVQDVVRALQEEAMARADRVTGAAAPEAGSALFDSFGPAAPRTEFVSPLHEATTDADNTPQAPAEQKSSLQPTEPAQIEVPQQAADTSRQATQRTGAPSFTAQLQRSRQMLRTASMHEARAPAAPQLR